MRNLLIILLFVIITAVSLFAAPMHGTYTIGGTSPNYATINDAVTDLIANGVDGYTTFDLRTGTYNEQIIIPEITGTSSTNYIVFKSESGNADDVTISHTATTSADNYIVRLDGADYFDFHYLTFRAEGTTNLGTIFELMDGTSYVQIRYNKFYSLGYNQPYSYIIKSQPSGTQSIEHIEIQSNYFQDAYYGVYFYGNSATSFNDLSVSYNLFYNQMNAVSLTRVPFAQIQDNRITDVNQGIMLSNCSSASILKNDITVHKTGISLSYSNDADVINNSISADGIVWEGNFGMATGFVINNSNNSEIYYNSVNIESTTESASSYAFSVMSGSGHIIENNIFSNFGKGSAVYFTSVDAGDMIMDYNNIFVGRGYLVQVGSYNPDMYYSISEFQTGFGDNVHSISYYPAFSATTLQPLSPWIDAKGVNLSSVTEDINGNPRDASTPDIGCYEYTPDPAYSTPMNGHYSVGTGYDYENLHEALNDLFLKGVDGSVNFDLNNGTYTGNYNLYNVPSNNSSNAVTISLGTGDPDLSYAATSSDDNYLFRLMGGTTFYSLNYLTMEATGTTYSKVLDVSGYNHFRILGGSISAPFTTSGDHNKDLIYFKDAKIHNVDINTTFNNGSTAIYLYGDSNNYSSELKIWNCDFNNNYTGIYLNYSDSPEISGNTFNENYKSITISSAINNIRMENNRITKSSKSGDAISISNSTGGDTQEERGLIANNAIKMTDCGGSKGLNFNSNKFDIVYNSILVVGDGSALYAPYDDGTNVYENNIFATTGTGKAIDGYGSSFTSVMDYNNLYCEGTTLLRLGTNYYTNLEELQTQTGGHLHSLSTYPYFTEDMHTISPLMNARGISVNNIIDTDMDGQYRTNPPDIGADSFSPLPGNEPMAGTYTIGLNKSDFSSFTDAAYALSYRGISDSTTFLVESGTYTEQVEFKQIYGVDDSKKIIFKSNTGIDSDVILQYGPTVSDSNYVVFINGTDYIVFIDLTIRSTTENNYYNTLFRIQGDADHIQINSNTLHNDIDTNYGDGNSLIYSQNNSFTSRIIYGNTFENGYYGYTNYAYNNGETSGLLIGHNSFENTKYPISCSSDGIQIYNNTMTDFTTAIAVSNSDGQTKIYNNKMITTGFNDYYHGYTLFRLDSSDGTESEPILIYNNTLRAYDNHIASLSGYSISSCQYVDFYHNNSVIENDFDNYIDNTRGSALSISSSDHIKIKNNILAYKGNGLAYNLQSGGYTNYEIDYNDLYNEGMLLAQIGQDKFKTVEDIQNNSAYDNHSVKAPPLLDSNLYTTSKFLNEKGTPVSEVTTDIEGNLRDAITPDIGCLEFTPTSPWEPISGTKTIGTSKADYSTITEAMNDLMSRGVTGGIVTFNIESGTYSEQLNLLYIPRDNFTGYVAIKSQSGNADDVVIQFDASGDDDNYLMKIIGSNNLSFSHLTFSPQDAYYNKIAWIKGYNEFFTISNCIFNGVEDANYNAGALISFDLASFTSIWLSNNEFNNGGYGIYYSNYNYPEYAHALILTNNTFNNNYQSLYLKSISGLFIDSNTFTDQSNTVIRLDNITEDLSIYKNSAITSRNRCLSLDDYDGSLATTHRIANNYFDLTNTTQQQPYETALISNTSYLDIYLNTFKIDENYSLTYALNLGAGNTNMNIQDNIFANNDIGYAVKVQDDSGLLTMDHNLFYTQGTNFANWEGTDYSDLATLQTATSLNGVSILDDPIFATSDSPVLQSSSPAINAGVEISSITEDIYGTSRAIPYDIGAYEYVGGITPSIPQNVTIEIVNNGTTARISWNAASQATQYKVEASDNPTDGFTVVSTTTNTTADIPISTMKKFYRVIAIH